MNGGLLPVTVPALLGYGGVLVLAFYLGFAALTRTWPRLRVRPLAYTVVMFMLFGAAGEEVVNRLWRIAFDAPLWEYRLYPIHGGNISLFFFQVWGIFGFYSYLRDSAFPGFGRAGTALSALVFGIEAIALELAVNLPYHALFGDFIFYYLPANLGPFSHYSCLQVIPFYMAIALTTRRLVAVQKQAGYMHLKSTLGFYAMVMAAYLFPWSQ